MQMLAIFGVTFGALVLVIAGMAVGVMLGRKPISGSCGGLNSQTDANGNSSCSLCSQPSDACRELRERMPQPSAEEHSSENDSSTFADCEKDCETQGCSKETIDACKGR